MVFLIAHKAVQRTVNGVILTRFYFNRNSDQVFVIINQIVHLALIAIVVIEQLASMGDISSIPIVLFQRQKSYYLAEKSHISYKTIQL